jgi:hypothetical protein
MLRRPKRSKNEVVAPKKEEEEGWSVRPKHVAYVDGKNIICCV